MSTLGPRTALKSRKLSGSLAYILAQTNIKQGTKAAPNDVAGCTLEMGADGLWTGSLGTLTQEQADALVASGVLASVKVGTPGNVAGVPYSWGGAGVGWIAVAEYVAEIAVSSTQPASDIQSAIDALSNFGLSEAVRAVVVLGSGNYVLSSPIATADYVDIICRDVSKAVIKLYQPDSTSAAQIEANSTIEFKTNTILSGLEIRGKNVRYAVHHDAAPQCTRSKIHNCTIIHEGNPSANNTWAARNGLGVGLHGGESLVVDGCDISGDLGTAGTYNVSHAMYVHNWGDQPSPCSVDVINTALRSNGYSLALRIEGIGSTQKDTATIRGVVGFGALAIDGTDFSVSGGANSMRNSFSTVYDPAMIGTHINRIHFDGGTEQGHFVKYKTDAYGEAFRAVKRAELSDSARLVIGVTSEPLIDYGKMINIRTSGNALVYIASGVTLVAGSLVGSDANGLGVVDAANPLAISVGAFTGPGLHECRLLTLPS